MDNAGAISAWEAGASGKGVTVAVIDSGIQMDHQDLATNISPLSTDVVAGRDAPQGDDRHGTRVASVIAAPYNNFGTVGIAFNSTILSVRADISDCQEEDQEICFRSSDLTNAINYAVSNGAKVINLSLGGEGTMGATFEAALQRAIQAGVIFAISSGNESEDNPGWPGRYASDPRFAGGIIVVGAHNSANVMSDFSNRAGVSQNWYLSGPGEGIVVDCQDTSCWRVNGTSFSAPAVAAAMALLKEAFPNLSGRDIVDILLRTAQDAGDAGTDTTYGRGLLDIAQAFQPVGTTSTPQATGQAVNVASQPGSFMGGPFGDAIGRTDALATIAYDEYQRLFKVDMGQAFRAAPRRSHQVRNPTPMRQSEVSLDGLGGTRLSLVAAVPVEMPEPVVSRYTPFDAPWLGDEDRSEAMFSIQAGRVAFSAWQGKGGAHSPFRTGSGDSFTALAQADHALRGAMQMGRLTFSAESGSGDRQAMLTPVERDVSTYARAAVDWRGEQAGLSFSLGALDEKMGPLGAYMPLASDLAMPSRTSFTAFGANYSLGRNLVLSGEIGLGRTDIDGHFMSLAERAISSTWRLALQSDCPGFIPGCSQLVWQIAQPLRIESGEFSALLADVPLDYFDPVTFSERRFSAAPSGREIDFSVRSLHPLPGGSLLQLEAMAIREEQHRAGAPLGYALIGSWRRGF
ncbi:S8 family peptidase [Brevundimonas vesicularis]|uniref:S8 family peptidase n=1 Tax=Brevundimonas vesicularis TaxID=41276 RepID=UPI0038D45A31